MYKDALLGGGSVFRRKYKDFCAMARWGTVATGTALASELFLQHILKFQPRNLPEPKPAPNPVTIQDLIQSGFVTQTSLPSRNQQPFTKNQLPFYGEEHIHRKKQTINEWYQNHRMEFSDGKLIEVKLDAKNLSSELAAERAQEEASLPNDYVLLEQHSGCLFCHASFDDGETAYFYGCNPTHLYHSGCIAEWEASKNNGYFKAPTRCHNSCGVSYEKDQYGFVEKKGQELDIITPIKVKLRATAHPDYVEFKVVGQGVLCDPCDARGNLITQCICCEKVFKSGNVVAYANIHPDCGSNHIVHKNCLEHFRMNKFGNAPRAREGGCWEGRGLSCPYSCVDPVLHDTGFSQKTAKDHLPVVAVVQYTQEPKPMQLSLLIEKNKVVKLPFDRTFECDTCGKNSDKDTGRDFIEITCTSCGHVMVFCDPSEESKRSDVGACLKNTMKCYGCYNQDIPSSVFKQGTWYRS